MTAPLSSLLALDTSVAVPLVVADHTHHGAVTRWWAQRDVHLSGHAAVETYAVLTRLPGDLRLSPDDAVTLLERRFASTLPLPAEVTASVPHVLADLGVAGGATYDALVALAALHHGATLATRDLRARDTYERVGASVVVVA